MSYGRDHKYVQTCGLKTEGKDSLRDIHEDGKVILKLTITK
jgi:hypothetical protein